MKSFGKDLEVIEFLKYDLHLISSSVERFDIYSDDFVLTIDIRFKLLYTKAEVILSFKNVVEYAFYYNNTHYFYNVETLKFFNIEDNIYLSLDPDDGPGISEDDNDFILSKSVEGFITYL